MSLRWISEALGQLDAEGLLRTRRPAVEHPGAYVTIAGRRLMNLCSNDYLGLSGTPMHRDASGAGASRLVGGDTSAHVAFERAVADWLQVEDALSFTSGYAANVGTIAALAGPGTLIVSDAQNHASIVDGARLSRARVVVTPHLDVASARDALRAAPERRRLVLTDAYFSMDGDVPDLAALRAACDEHDAALFVDEAHGLGVFGPEGRGAAAAAGVRPDVLIGTLGKSFGTAGAFVAGSRDLVRWLWNRARSFVFSTGAPPAVVATALDHLPAVRDGERAARLADNVRAFRAALAEAGVAVHPASVGPIVPVLLGDPRRAVAAGDALGERGYFVHPMRPPTVAPGTSRLRLTVRADHAADELRAAARAIAEVLR